MNQIWKLRIIIFIICFSFAYSANAKVVAAISTLKGLVMVKPIGSRKYIPAYKGQMLNNGEWVKTKEIRGPKNQNKVRIIYITPIPS